MSRFVVLSTAALIILLGHFTVYSWIPNNHVCRLKTTTSRKGNIISNRAQRSPITENSTDEKKNEFFFPWSKTSGNMNNQVEYLESNNEISSNTDIESEKMSPELIGAGAIAAFVVAGGMLGLAKNMEVR